MAGAGSSRAGRREWLGLAVLALPCLLYSMDLTVLHLAVPQLTADLKPSSSELLWIVDIYGFLVGGSLITMGTLGDRIGRRRLLLSGAVAFGAASVLAAFSVSAGMLIAARALLGVAAATLAPSTLSLIRNMFLDAGQRTVAVGVWIASFSAGGAIGPLLGGLLLEHFWWGSVFLLNAPVMALLLVLGPVLLPEFRDPKAGRLDLASAALSLVALLSVTWGIKTIAGGGRGAPAAWAIAAGLAFGAWFLHRQSRLRDPLLDLSMFRSSVFSVALGVNVVGFFVAFGTFLFIAQYLQLVLGMGPLAAGLWTAPSGVAFIAGSLLAPPLARKLGASRTIAGGFGVAFIGFVVLTGIGGHGGPGLVVTAYIVLSLGLAPVFTMATDLIVGAAPPERAGIASGLSETSTEIGGALGIAVLGCIVTAIYRNLMASAVPGGVASGVAEVARDTLGGAVETARHLPVAAGAPLLEAARAAFTQAVVFTSALSAGLALAAAILSAILLRDVGLTPKS